MINLKNINTLKIFFLINLFFISSVQADNLIISETLEKIQNDIKTLIQLDEKLRYFDPIDPVKYDYALFGLGVNK